MATDRFFWFLILIVGFTGALNVFGVPMFDSLLIGVLGAFVFVFIGGKLRWAS